MRVDLELGDDRWLPLLTELWHPFLLPPSDVPAERIIRVTASDLGWAVSLDDGDPAEYVDPWDAAARIRYHLVEEVLTYASAYLIDLHAAVLLKGEVVLLLAGGSRVGKTTLTLSLLEAGWSFMSDDVAPIEELSGEILPFPKPVGIRNPELWGTFASRWNFPNWPPPPASAFLLPAAALGKPLDDRALPTHLVFPRYVADEDPQLQELSRAKAIALCGELVRRFGPRRMRTMLSLWEPVNTARLTYPSQEAGLGLLKGWLSARA